MTAYLLTNALITNIAFFVYPYVSEGRGCNFNNQPNAYCAEIYASINFVFYFLFPSIFLRLIRSLLLLTIVHFITSALCSFIKRLISSRRSIFLLSLFPSWNFSRTLSILSGKCWLMIPFVSISYFFNLYLLIVYLYEKTFPGIMRWSLTITATLTGSSRVGVRCAGICPKIQFHRGSSFANNRVGTTQFFAKLVSSGWRGNKEIW